MDEVWYRIVSIPDLTLNKYSSLEGSGVDGLLDKHISLLRQLNRKGIISEVSFHLMYLYIADDIERKEDYSGKRLTAFLVAKGKKEKLESVKALIASSFLSEFFKIELLENKKYINQLLSGSEDEEYTFKYGCFLTKSDMILDSDSLEGDGYYFLRNLESNDSGRLYNMFRLMEELNHTVLYRVDLYPVDKSIVLRDSLKRSMNMLRKSLKESIGRGIGNLEQDVLDNYEDIIEKFETSPHFIANIMVFANIRDDALSVLDAAGAESVEKGQYRLTAFANDFLPDTFISSSCGPLENIRDEMALLPAKSGVIVCKESLKTKKLNYLSQLFTVDEIAPFFRYPSLYDGEAIQLPKETAPVMMDDSEALYLGKDKNGYDVNIPLKLLPKHAFISGVPGSGKTNSMHHIVSSLWKKHRIPFLVLEPAKQEYRALMNDPDMLKGENGYGLHLFSPNADMSFPLHINPFQMAKGIMVSEHIRTLCSVFEGAFPLENPMPFLLDTAIEAVYRELGWIPEHVYTGDEVDENGKKRPLPTMYMLYKRLEEELKITKYSDEVRGNMESALKVRIGSLLRREMGDIFDVPESTISPEDWLKIPAVIELESMGSGPANFLTLILCSLIRQTLKVNPKFDGDVRHLIFLEEAHNLIGPISDNVTGNDADPKQAATAFIVKMLAEVRALKEGIVIADQLPTVMAQEVLKNTGLKLALKITSVDDRNLLGGTMSATNLQLEQMGTLNTGQAFISYEKLQKPFTVQIAKYDGDIEYRNDNELRELLYDYIVYQEDNISSMNIICDKYIRIMGDMQFDEYNNEYRHLLSYKKFFKDVAQKMGNNFDKFSSEEKNKFVNLQNNFNELYDDDERDSEFVNLLSKTVEIVKSLRRLKNCRWKRLGMNDKIPVIANRIEIAAVELLQEEYNLYYDAVGKKQLFTDVNKEIQSMLLAN